MQFSSEQTRTADGQLIEIGTLEQHGGREFSAFGASVTPEYAAGYLSNDGRHVTTWNGETLGTARIVASWRTPKSFVSSHQFQVEATICGRVYTGRTGGRGMLWRGRATKKQPRRAADPFANARPCWMREDVQK